jgi:hypothetical protein
MPVARLIAVAGVTTASLALSPVAAMAAGNVNTIEASPGTVKPGGSVTLSISNTTCPKDKTFSGSVDSTGWQFTLTPGTMSLVGTLNVPASAKPGSYTAVGSCPTGGLIVSGSFTVSGGSAPTSPSTSSTLTSPPPTGAVATGDGGGTRGMSGTEIALGVALAGAAVVGGTVAVRRRSGGDNT